jgi:hypothetical protein
MEDLQKPSDFEHGKEYYEVVVKVAKSDPLLYGVAR